MAPTSASLVFRQLFDAESSTFTYVLADTQTREAVIIDPVLEQVSRDAKLLEDMSLKLKCILETHVHADHITGAGELRARTGAKIGLSASAGATGADLKLKDGDRVEFGAHSLRVVATPGHTNGCLTYAMPDRVFTGDALMIRFCGRTDFQQGSPETLYESVTQKLFTLPDETLIYPGHDYKGMTVSTIGEEKRLNQRIGGKSKAQFVETMNSLNLPMPKRLHEAVPANLACGVKS